MIGGEESPPFLYPAFPAKKDEKQGLKYSFVCVKMEERGRNTARDEDSAGSRTNAGAAWARRDGQGETE